MTRAREEIIGSARLILGDCREFIEPLRAAACVLTDPPYGISYSSGHKTDRLWAEKNIRNDADTSLRDLVLSLLAGVPMLVFGSRRRDLPKDCRMVLTWDKGPALGMGDLSIPWKPTTEEIYVVGRGFVGSRTAGAVIYHPPVQSMAKNGRVHPNEKPVGLFRRLLQNMPGGAVADPFMGSGSCGVAAILEGRSYVGCEEVPKYFDIALRRIEAAQRQRDLFIEPPVAEPPEDMRLVDLFAEPAP